MTFIRCKTSIDQMHKFHKYEEIKESNIERGWLDMVGLMECWCADVVEFADVVGTHGPAMAL